MSADFEKVSRDSSPQANPRGMYSAAIEAALADPDSAIVVKGLTMTEVNAVYQAASRRGATASRIREPDGTYTVYVTAGRS